MFLPSGGHLVIDRTEAMTVVDVNTGKYTGAGGNLEETVTRNNLEAAEEIVRQLRLRDLGGIIVIDFIDMVLESNRELVLRRLTECLGRDRTKHQVTEITSLGLVQMTRKRIGQGLLEAFSETCEHCKGRGVIIHTEPVPEKRSGGGNAGSTAKVAARRRCLGHRQPAAWTSPTRRRPAQPAAGAAAAGGAGASPRSRRTDVDRRPVDGRTRSRTSRSESESRRSPAEDDPDGVDEDERRVGGRRWPPPDPPGWRPRAGPAPDSG